jgi:acetoin utilization deacetylase AcuC-like enzyme
MDSNGNKATAGPLRGIGGGVVVDTNKGHAIRHQKRSEDEATTSAVVYPPDLVCQMTCGELGISVDTTFHPSYSSTSAKVAAGSLISLVDAIVQAQLKNGFALIRPPGKTLFF